MSKLISTVRHARRDAVCIALFTLSLAAVQGCKSHHAATNPGADSGTPTGDANGDTTLGGSDGDARGQIDAGNGGDARGNTGPDAGPDQRAPDAGTAGDGAGAGAGTNAGDAAGGGPDAAADGGAGAPEVGSGDGGFGAGCNTLTLGAAITFDCSTDPAPTPTGGPIVPGTYRLTAATVYGPCAAGIMAAQALAITATTLQATSDDPVIGPQRLNANYTVVGTDMMQTNTCPNTDTRTVGFTATATTLTIFSNNQGAITVGVMTRQ